jgi:Ca2+/Na+ antiporter
MAIHKHSKTMISPFKFFNGFVILMLLLLYGISIFLIINRDLSVLIGLPGCIILTALYLYVLLGNRKKRTDQDGVTY